MQDLEFITTKTVHIPENPAWFMTESMRPFASFPQMIFRRKCTAQQDASIPQELHWHCQKIPVKMP